MALSRTAVRDLQALGASCWLIFRSFLPLLASLGLSQCHFWHLLAALSLSERIFVDFERFSKPQNLPRTSKINKKPLVFLGFLLFSCFAQDDRKSSKNAPRKLPRLPQTPPKSSQNILKWHRRAPKWLQDAFWHSRTPPRHAPGAPKTRQDCPRHVRTTKKPPRPPQNSIFEGLGS